MPKIIGKIKPDSLRQEILFAKQRVDLFSRNPGRPLKTWSDILQRLIDKIKCPSE